MLSNSCEMVSRKSSLEAGVCGAREKAICCANEVAIASMDNSSEKVDFMNLNASVRIQPEGKPPEFIVVGNFTLRRAHRNGKEKS